MAEKPSVGAKSCTAPDSTDEAKPIPIISTTVIADKHAMSSSSNTDAKNKSNSSSSSNDNKHTSKDAVSINTSVVLRYPFMRMSLIWWDDYLHTVPAADRVQTMLRVMDCLMAHSVLHEDPFLEEAVMHINKKLPKAWSTQAPACLISSFELSHHAFRTICVTTKYTTLDSNGKQTLLALIDSRVNEIKKVTLSMPSLSSGSEVNNSNSGASSFIHSAISAALSRIASLRKEPNSRVIFVELVDSLKRVYFSVNRKSGVGPRSSAAVMSTSYDTFVCCEACPCFTRLSTGYTVFVQDVEKAKFIDCLMYAAVNEKDEFMRSITSELLNNHFRDFMETPALDDIARMVHNGRLFNCRTAVFDALNLVRYISQMHSDPSQVIKDGTITFDRVVLSILWVKNELQSVKGFETQISLLNRALVTAQQVYHRLGKGDCLDLLNLVRSHLANIFATLSAPEYHLAVHSRKAFLDKAGDMHCANTACPLTESELLKCSGCDVTYYCSTECQKADWSRHRTFCQELESRKGRPEPMGSEMGPSIRILPCNT